VSAAALRARDRRAAGSISQIIDLNRDAKLGSVSIRFRRPTGQSGIFRSSQELTPEQALLEIMAGNPIEATTVTWKTYNSRGKRGTSSSRKVRVKIRNAETKQFTTLASFEKWFDGVTANGPTQSNTPPPSSSTHSTKR
jgi:hypothetical protein